MRAKLILFAGFILIVFLIVLNALVRIPNKNSPPQKTDNQQIISKKPSQQLPIFINNLRKRPYPASEIVIEQTLDSGTNYERYIASYHSDGLKIYGLLTIPSDPKPAKKLPAIIFVHGHLDPPAYETTQRYIAYQDGFARNGFLTFKPDLRGHGKSEGIPVNSSFSEGYVVDTLNLLSALKKDSHVDAKRIGVWGHSMGGGIALRDMVISKDIKAGVVWAGVIGDYEDLLQKYYLHAPWMTSQLSSPEALDLFSKYGSPSANSPFWNQIDPYTFLPDISGPIQLHHGLADDNVPVEFSRHLQSALQKIKKPVEEYEYATSDHNLSQGFNLAMQRSVEFFKKNL